MTVVFFIKYKNTQIKRISAIEGTFKKRSKFEKKTANR
jgi:hypothetical protein